MKMANGATLTFEKRDAVDLAIIHAADGDGTVEYPVADLLARHKGTAESSAISAAYERWKVAPEPTAPEPGPLAAAKSKSTMTAAESRRQDRADEAAEDAREDRAAVKSAAKHK